ncbi:hypothetical protein GR140_29285 (plasmid) [Pseudomonas putida]|uniref:hypothetical protein n=1 Tax=Pseudomonas putida TaxID=303 RepID=UPI001BAF2EBD|nr:hypothetical protein [Pseudomonas putida]QUG92842.1 hypothetical protein GR140_29285 [Pseudomonas putida]
MLNLTKLFYASYADTEHLHGALMPEDEQKAFLRSCRTKIRDYLKPAIAEATVYVLGMRKQVQPGVWGAMEPKTNVSSESHRKGAFRSPAHPPGITL